MTGADEPDEDSSGNGSDRAGRFSDIASEFSDEFGVRSEDDPAAGHESESPGNDADAGGWASESDTDTDNWEWVGDDESEVTTDRNPSGSRVSDASERSNRDGRLWNDGPADDEPAGGSPTDDEPTDDEPTDDKPTEDAPANDELVWGDPADDEPAWGDPADDEPAWGGPTEAGADQTAADTAGSEPEPSRDGRTDATSERIWNEGTATRGPSTTTEKSRPASGGSVSAESPATGAPEASGASGVAEDESVLDGDRFDRGTNVLIQSESRSERTRDGCHELLFGHRSDLEPYVLLVRYQPMDGERLEDIASKGHQIHLISVGYAQSVPPTADGTVEATQINNPNDITRLGIIVSRITQEWSTDDREIRVCYDSLNVLLNYRDVKNVFRFLHVFLSTFTKTDAVAHFHVDPLEGDPQAINTLKPLFDEVVSMDSTGTYVE